MRGSRGWVRGGAALLALVACSGKALTPDAGGAPDGPAAETGAPEVASESDVASERDVALERTEGGLCTRTHDRATVLVLAPGGELLSCGNSPEDAGPVSPPRTWVGKVTESDETTLVIDVCAADGGCDPLGLRIEARAPGLDLKRFPHEWVQVRAAFSNLRGCAQWLELTAATPLDGPPSPRPAGQLLLAVVDGVPSFTGATYSVEPTRLGCSSEKGCGGPTPDDYALDFSAAPGAAPLRVYMGETATWTAGPTLRVRNLRSFQSIACDDYLNWAYTLYVDPPS